ncbi:uncharacterized protein LOC142485039 [Ascaphus truei]|uniref:uncharacterized protein LOC142485039 n=1 Tax=Ascaphus truei TaxID=8439 RepID=UPI003F5A44B8
MFCNVAASESPDLASPAFHLRRIGRRASVPDVAEYIHFLKPTTLIGRNKDVVDYFISCLCPQGTNYISRTHARVIHTSSYHDFKLVDSSLTGVYVNDVRIDAEHILYEGDTVTFGHPSCTDIVPGTRARQPSSESYFLFERCYCETGHTSAGHVPARSSATPQIHPFPSISAVSSVKVNCGKELALRTVSPVLSSRTTSRSSDSLSEAPSESECNESLIKGSSSHTKSPSILPEAYGPGSCTDDDPAGPGVHGQITRSSSPEYDAVQLRASEEEYSQDSVFSDQSSKSSNKAQHNEDDVEGSTYDVCGFIDQDHELAAESCDITESAYSEVVHSHEDSDNGQHLYDQQERTLVECGGQRSSQTHLDVHMEEEHDLAKSDGLTYSDVQTNNPDISRDADLDMKKQVADEMCKQIPEKVHRLEGDCINGLVENQEELGSAGLLSLNVEFSQDSNLSVQDSEDSCNSHSVCEKSLDTIKDSPLHPACKPSNEDQGDARTETSRRNESHAFIDRDHENKRSIDAVTGGRAEATRSEKSSVQKSPDLSDPIHEKGFSDEQKTSLGADMRLISSDVNTDYCMEVEKQIMTFERVANIEVQPNKPANGDTSMDADLGMKKQVADEMCMQIPEKVHRLEGDCLNGLVENGEAQHIVPWRSSEAEATRLSSNHEFPQNSNLPVQISESSSNLHSCCENPSSTNKDDSLPATCKTPNERQPGANINTPSRNVSSYASNAGDCGKEKAAEAVSADVTQCPDITLYHPYPECTTEKRASCQKGKGLVANSNQANLSNHMAAGNHQLMKSEGVTSSGRKTSDTDNQGAPVGADTGSKEERTNVDYSNMPQKLHHSLILKYEKVSQPVEENETHAQEFSKMYNPDSEHDARGRPLSYPEAPDSEHDAGRRPLSYPEAPDSEHDAGRRPLSYPEAPDSEHDAVGRPLSYPEAPDSEHDAGRRPLSYPEAPDSEHDAVGRPLSYPEAPDSEHDAVGRPLASPEAPDSEHDAVGRPLSSPEAPDSEHDAVGRPLASPEAPDSEHDAVGRPLASPEAPDSELDAGRRPLSYPEAHDIHVNPSLNHSPLLSAPAVEDLMQGEPGDASLNQKENVIHAKARNTFLQEMYLEGNGITEDSIDGNVSLNQKPIDPLIYDGMDASCRNEVSCPAVQSHNGDMNTKRGREMAGLGSVYQPSTDDRPGSTYSEVQLETAPTADDNHPNDERMYTGEDEFAVSNNLFSGMEESECPGDFKSIPTDVAGEVKRAFGSTANTGWSRGLHKAGGVKRNVQGDNAGCPISKSTTHVFLRSDHVSPLDESSPAAQVSVLGERMALVRELKEEIPDEAFLVPVSSEKDTEQDLHFTVLEGQVTAAKNDIEDTFSQTIDADFEDLCEEMTCFSPPCEAAKKLEVSDSRAESSAGKRERSEKSPTAGSCDGSSLNTQMSHYTGVHHRQSIDCVQSEKSYRDHDKDDTETKTLLAVDRKKWISCSDRRKAAPVEDNFAQVVDAWNEGAAELPEAAVVCESSCLDTRVKPVSTDMQTSASERLKEEFVISPFGHINATAEDDGKLAEKQFSHMLGNADGSEEKVNMDLECTDNESRKENTVREFPTDLPGQVQNCNLNLQKATVTQPETFVQRDRNNVMEKTGLDKSLTQTDASCPLSGNEQEVENVELNDCNVGDITAFHNGNIHADGDENLSDTEKARIKEEWALASRVDVGSAVTVQESPNQWGWITDNIEEQSPFAKEDIDKRYNHPPLSVKGGDDHPAHLQGNASSGSVQQKGDHNLTIERKENMEEIEVEDLSAKSFESNWIERDKVEPFVNLGVMGKDEIEDGSNSSSGNAGCPIPHRLQKGCMSEDQREMPLTSLSPHFDIQKDSASQEITRDMDGNTSEVSDLAETDSFGKASKFHLSGSKILDNNSGEQCLVRDFNEHTNVEQMHPQSEGFDSVEVNKATNNKGSQPEQETIREGEEEAVTEQVAEKCFEESTDQISSGTDDDGILSSLSPMSFVFSNNSSARWEHSTVQESEGRNCSETKCKSPVGFHKDALHMNSVDPGQTHSCYKEQLEKQPQVSEGESSYEFHIVDVRSLSHVEESEPALDKVMKENTRSDVAVKKPCLDSGVITNLELAVARKGEGLYNTESDLESGGIVKQTEVMSKVLKTGSSHESEQVRSLYREDHPRPALNTQTDVPRSADHLIQRVSGGYDSTLPLHTSRETYNRSTREGATKLKRHFNESGICFVEEKQNPNKKRCQFQAELEDRTQISRAQDAPSHHRKVGSNQAKLVGSMVRQYFKHGVQAEQLVTSEVTSNVEKQHLLAQLVIDFFKTPNDSGGLRDGSPTKQNVTCEPKCVSSSCEHPEKKHSKGLQTGAGNPGLWETGEEQRSGAEDTADHEVSSPGSDLDKEQLFLVQMPKRKFEDCVLETGQSEGCQQDIDTKSKPGKRRATYMGPDVTGSSEPDVTGSSEPDVTGSSEPDVTGSSEPDVTGSSEPDVTGSSEPDVTGSSEPELRPGAHDNVLIDVRGLQPLDLIGSLQLSDRVSNSFKNSEKVQNNSLPQCPPSTAEGAQPVCVTHTTPSTAEAVQPVCVTHTTPSTAEGVQPVCVTHTTPSTAEGVQPVCVTHTTPSTAEGAQPVCVTHTTPSPAEAAQPRERSLYV